MRRSTTIGLSGRDVEELELAIAVDVSATGVLDGRAVGVLELLARPVGVLRFLDREDVLVLGFLVEDLDLVDEHPGDALEIHLRLGLGHDLDALPVLDVRDLLFLLLLGRDDHRLLDRRSPTARSPRTWPGTRAGSGTPRCCSCSRRAGRAGSRPGGGTRRTPSSARSSGGERRHRARARPRSRRSA